MTHLLALAQRAHAVLDLNNEDGYKRKFILVEMEDYADKITAERVRHAIKNDKQDVGFTYHTLGPAIDADTMLSGNLPTYNELAKYVFYLATGKNHPDEKKIKRRPIACRQNGARINLPNLRTKHGCSKTTGCDARLGAKNPK